ncbi:endonuclease/exonuclease/phosphatase family protein [Pedobacter nototheniae]|uniref:endonuclease/exonuclease/phosphatase family protein n=1 Tax=Pedobacter nototheniae TaxID=2488994 RepID=UPI001B8B31C3|nr:endonuclease/exonuclease/phosphatase family protein [Pedobacter nototheniae]
MKKNKCLTGSFLYVLPVLMLLGLNVDAQKKNREVSIKAMTYNIFSARKLGIGAIADVIKKIDPDIVSLQEVERHTDINPIDFPKVLAEMTGMKYYYFARALTLKKGDYGNAILSKYPLSHEQTFQLGVAEDGDNLRSFGYAEVKKDGKRFFFATTHLGYKFEDATRLKQISEILDKVTKLDKPILLGADLNTRPGSSAMPALQKWFTTACQGGVCEWTVPTPKPTYTCDWLIYAPLEAFSVKEYAVPYWADKQSDHYPVVATFTLK